MANQNDILDPGFRKQVIQEMIDGSENIDRKMRALKKHEIYRDKNSKWVIEQLHHEEFDKSTRCQMENRVSNVSICRKVINKIAQTYVGGSTRIVDDQSSQDSINLLEKELDANTAMKKSDRYRQLFANTLVHPVPVLNTRESDRAGKAKYDLKLKVLSPWEYDVIEDPNDLTMPMVVIVADFPERFRADHHTDNLKGSQGIRGHHGGDSGTSGDRVEQTIADSPSDKGAEDDKREFIWWSDNWHFTTDSKGKIIASAFPDKDGVDAVRNPIGSLPFINITQDQDCHYWAQGGDDVVDSSLLVNKILTDINFITYLQGWGQLVISGKDLPNKIAGGPGKALIFPTKEGDPTPQVFYASSNPPIDSWLNTAKSQLAMMLSTNDLSVRQIGTNLDAAQAASGIALMIEQSEMISTQENIQQLYRDKEPEVWELIRLWHEYYSDLSSLSERFQVVPKFSDSNVKIKFHRVRPPITETEKLQELKMRKELGLNTEVELLQKDNPDLSEEDAEDKLEELKGGTVPTPPDKIPDPSPEEDKDADGTA